MDKFYIYKKLWKLDMILESIKKLIFDTEEK